jgi:hypothetical protein
MKVKKLARPIGFAAMVVVVAVSILVAGAKEPAPLRSGARAVRPKGPAAPEAKPRAAQPAREPMGRSSAAMMAREAGLGNGPETAKAGAPKAAETFRAPAKPPAPPMPRADSPKRSLAYGSLPPLMLDSSGPEAGAQGPPPGVLWLAGVIHGSPKLAVIRRGQERFMVREGDSVGGIYRVSRITADTVTLQHGRRTLVLRLGQFS